MPEFKARSLASDFAGRAGRKDRQADELDGEDHQAQGEDDVQLRVRGHLPASNK